MYRVLRENAQVSDRGRLARHPARTCPDLVATAPRQVYSWDITKLAGPVKGRYFDAYVMIDIDLEVTWSHSRPRVSNDNPYSEAVFKTLKYGPGFPDRFGALSEARGFMIQLSGWYNHEHRHTGIGLHTPADVHFGLAAGKAAERRQVLDAARARHPHGFGTTNAPKILDLPDTVWINQPAEVPRPPWAPNVSRLTPAGLNSLDKFRRATPI